MSASSSASWRLHRDGDLCWATCEGLEAIAGVGHAFSTRCGDGRDFDIGPVDDRRGPYASRLGRLFAVANLDDQPLYPLKQVHGGDVAVADPTGPVEADAAARRRDDLPRFVVGVRTADCVPILLADREGRALAAVHAGWRGTVARIAPAAVERLARFGVQPQGIVAALGPAIGPCCYEVGADVALAVVRAGGFDAEGLVRSSVAGRPHLDLHAANRLQIEAAGVPAEAIHAAPWCTACRADLFFSFRRDGPTGRLLACIGWRGDS